MNVAQARPMLGRRPDVEQVARNEATEEPCQNRGSQTVVVTSPKGCARAGGNGKKRGIVTGIRAVLADSIFLGCKSRWVPGGTSGSNRFLAIGPGLATGRQKRHLPSEPPGTSTIVRSMMICAAGSRFAREQLTAQGQVFEARSGINPNADCSRVTCDVPPPTAAITARVWRH